jgi:hypothetical protein
LIGVRPVCENGYEIDEEEEEEEGVKEEEEKVKKQRGRFVVTAAASKGRSTSVQRKRKRFETTVAPTAAASTPRPSVCLPPVTRHTLLAALEASECVQYEQLHTRAEVFAELGQGYGDTSSGRIRFWTDMAVVRAATVPVAHTCHNADLLRTSRRSWRCRRRRGPALLAGATGKMSATYL